MLYQGILVLCFCAVCIGAVFYFIRKAAQAQAQAANRDPADVVREQLKKDEEERGRRAQAEEQRRLRQASCAHTWSPWENSGPANHPSARRHRTCAACGAFQMCDHADIQMVGYDGTIYDRIEHFKCFTCGLAYDQSATS